MKYYKCKICGNLVDDGDWVNKICVDCDDKLDSMYFLSIAHKHAVTHSKCAKVQVGSIIVKRLGKNVRMCFSGANRVIPDYCNGEDCHMVLPHDGLPHCVATIHSEIDAIIRAQTSVQGATIYVTRYPCENCARAIVTAGIKTVVYGRTPEISEDTKRIFRESNILVLHKPEFNPEGE